IEAPVVNYSQPGPEYIRPFFVSVGYEHPPGEVKEAIRETLAGQPYILQDPPAAIRVDSYGDFAVSYEIRALVKDGAVEELVRDEALTLMWYVFKRHWIRIPFPIRDVTLHAPPDSERIAGETARGVEALLRDVEIMSPLSEEERSRVARAAHVHRYAEGEVLFRQGDAGESFFLIRTGSVDIVIQDAGGMERHLATLGPGEYFGEMSLLTGEPRSATARVTRDLVVVVITKDNFASLLETNPELADRFSEALARRQAEIHAELARETGQAHAFSSEEYKRGLRGRIRQFFRLKPRKEG
ncbi:MAG: cyclic nucleotide-binding domain-containing protein, partial [Nitrospirae bacterium]|nr:cyclic nucleotide-binding domain-containing protein [Nitrospirota bacterium]